MNFESAVDYLKSFISYEAAVNYQYDESNFNLQRLKGFLKKYGIVYDGVKYVHVGGSKGKGSVSTMIAGYLKEKEGKVGLFTSPYILDIRECFWIDGELISEIEFVKYVENLRGFIEKMGECELTYFELLTVLVLKYFVEKGCGWAVLEVGLGGRLDSTNIIDPELSILTTVEKEHTEILGDSLEEILGEKLGIVKEGKKFLVGFQSDEVSLIIRERLKGREKTFYVDEMEKEQLDLKVDLRSLAQIDNAKLAFAAIGLLFGELDEEVFEMVLRDFRMLGRFDIRYVEGETVVFDMAHTLRSAENLVKSLKKNFLGKKFVFLVSILRDKDLDGMMKMIIEVAERVVLTSVEGDRGLSGKELNEVLGGGFEVMEAPKKAYKRLLDSIAKDEVLVVAGSHYLLKELY